jgi:hypothetical protein
MEVVTTQLVLSHQCRLCPLVLTRDPYPEEAAFPIHNMTPVALSFHNLRTINNLSEINLNSLNMEASPRTEVFKATKAQGRMLKPELSRDIPPPFRAISTVKLILRIHKARQMSRSCRWWAAMYKWSPEKRICLKNSKTKA